MPLEEKVAMLMEATRRMQGVPGVSFAEAGIDLFRRSTWFASSDGAAIDQVVVMSGGGIEATAVGDRRRAAPLVSQLVPRAHQGRGLRARPLAGPDRGGRAHRARGGGPARGPRVPERGHHADPGLRADGAAGPRVDRPPDRARSGPRHGGGLRGLVVPVGGRPGAPALRQPPGLDHRRRHAAGRARHVRLTTTRGCRPSARRSSSTACSRTSSRAARPPASSARPPTGPAAPTGGVTCR